MLSRIFKAIPYLSVSLVIFVYLFFLNRFHLIHAEQMQLFRFDPSYAADIFALPGGLSSYLSKFLIQFFISPFAGTIILILLTGLLYFLFKKISERLYFYYSYLSIIPLVIFTAFQANHDYHLETTVAFIIMQLFLYLYLKIQKPVTKYAAIIVFPALAFILAGSSGIYLLMVILLIEIFKVKKHSLYVILSSLTGMLFIYLSRRYLFLCSVDSVLQSCSPVSSFGIYDLISFVILLLILPVFVLLSEKKYKIPEHPVFKVSLIILLLAHLSFSYDFKTEKLFQIEHYFTEKEYSKVVSLAEKYPGNNHLVVYLGNIALSRTSEMGDKLFYLRQMFGPEGLFMTHEAVNIATLYGGDLYEELNYTNEACHWFYNGMISNGQNPRILKHLVVFELVNGNYQIARKYLILLSHTLFYREWALEYSKYVKSPLLIVSDEKMAGMRKYSAYKDFYHDNFDSRLKSLLALYPGNRSAFSYLISYALLRKDMKSFMDYLPYLKDMKYTRLPVHIEEALLVCKATRPEVAAEVDKFNISESTKTRFDLYISMFESSGNDQKLAYKILAKNFKNTFWFYLDFFPYATSQEEANVQLFPY